MSSGNLNGVIRVRSDFVIAKESIPPYLCVVLDAVLDTATRGRQVKKPVAATDFPFGGTNNKIETPAGEQIEVILEGRPIGTANAAITRGALLIKDLNGKLGPAALVVGERIVGQAEESAAADGDYFSYTLRPHVF